jgi:hypothetical protein
MKVPVFPDPVLTQYLTDLAKEQAEAGQNYLTKGSANHSLLLQSPSNSIYEVLVNDLGVVNTNLILFSTPVTASNGMAVTEGLDRAVFFGTVPNAVGINWNYLSGLTLSTAGSSSTFSVAPGIAADKANADLMRLVASINKTTASWAVGTGNGALDTGAVTATPTWYHVHLIKRLDTGVVDVLFSQSATAPTLPTNYTLFRRIGSMKTNGSAQWTFFNQVGDEFLWDVPPLDVSASAIAANTNTNYTLSVPPGVNVLANYTADINTASNSLVGILFSCPDITSSPASTGSMSIGVAIGAAAQAHRAFGAILTRTNTSAQVRGNAFVASTLSIKTQGWTDTRGKLG